MSYKRISGMPVSEGGTGQTTLTTAYGVLCAGTTATGAVQTLSSLGTSGWVLTSNGAGALPSFQAGGGGGGGITTLDGDSGSATGSTVTLAGTANQITTSATSATVTHSIPSTFIAPGSIEATTTVKADTNFLLPTTSSTAGNINFNAVTQFHVYGTNNVFIGDGCGNYTMSGSKNQGIGHNVLAALTSGIYNTAIGHLALTACTSSSNNVAIGNNTLQTITSNASGDNVAIGDSCLTALITGSLNLGIGAGALERLGTGSSNTCIGIDSGYNYTGAESNNIIIGADRGSTGESNVTRIGFTGTNTSLQTSCFIDGISGVTVTGTAVLVSTSGQLGVAASSLRFKDNVVDMKDYSSPLMRLRPVTFTFKEENSDDRTVQSGLIAEEVADVMPQLVLNDEEGRPYTVKYHDLPALLLNELQKLTKEVDWLKDQLCSKDR